MENKEISAVIFHKGVNMNNKRISSKSEQTKTRKQAQTRKVGKKKLNEEQDINLSSFVKYKDIVWNENGTKFVIVTRYQRRQTVSVLDNLETNLPSTVSTIKQQQNKQQKQKHLKPLPIIPDKENKLKKQIKRRNTIVKNSLGKKTKPKSLSKLYKIKRQALKAAYDDFYKHNKQVKLDLKTIAKNIQNLKISKMLYIKKTLKPDDARFYVNLVNQSINFGLLNDDFRENNNENTNFESLNSDSEDFSSCSNESFENYEDGQVSYSILHEHSYCALGSVK